MTIPVKKGLPPGPNEKGGNSGQKVSPGGNTYFLIYIFISLQKQKTTWSAQGVFLVIDFLTDYEFSAVISLISEV